MSATWNVMNGWNFALESKDERVPEKRERLWASELTKSEVDTWLKLRGEPYTNPPNARSKRKFEAGNVFEWIMGIILKRAGLLVSEQKYVTYQYPGLLQVTGKIDFIAGGDIDYDGARKFADEIELPEVFKRCTEKVLEELKAKYPKGVSVKPIEIKSCSSFVMETVLAKQAPLTSDFISSITSSFFLVMFAPSFMRFMTLLNRATFGAIKSAYSCGSWNPYSFVR